MSKLILENKLQMLNTFSFNKQPSNATINDVSTVPLQGRSNVIPVQMEVTLDSANGVNVVMPGLGQTGVDTCCDPQTTDCADGSCKAPCYKNNKPIGGCKLKRPPNYVDANQDLLGPANPQTRIPPIIAPPLACSEYWKPNDFVIPSGINETGMQELYQFGICRINLLRT